MIYLDNAATTKPFKEALDYAAEYNDEMFFNPSALYHGGLEVNKSIKSARENIIKCLGNLNFDLFFTSCGSESDNTAIFSSFKRGNAVTTLGEHSAVHNTFLELKNRGFDVRFSKLNADGSVNVENLLSLIDNNTTFVSVVHVNNETGAINDINKIAKIVKGKNPRIIFHSDGVQAFGKLPYRIADEIDLYSVSAHKINALKGVGALFRNKKCHVFPLIYGGGQESGIRSGTENTFGIKVFEYAALEHFKTIREDYERVGQLKKEFISNLNLSNFKLISEENSSNYILYLSAVGLRGEVVQHMLEESNVIVGTGSACSAKHRFSRMLTDIGYSEDVMDGMIRISFNNKTTLDEAVFAAKTLDEAVKKLKKVITNG